MTNNDIAKQLKGKVLTFTGAGISVASGLKTFRGEGGLYEGRSAYELASPEGFKANPLLVWNWYIERARQVLKAKPNPAHHALAKLEKLALFSAIVTSNVDNLHESTKLKFLYKLHGNILEKFCTGCGKVCGLLCECEPKTYTLETLPRCSCGELQRPNVVWFGEQPRTDALMAVKTYLPQVDLVLEVGVSGAVSYGFTEVAVALGKTVVRINPEPAQQLGVLSLVGNAEEVLPQLVSLCAG
jgi:NAD-dependent deacetylase